MDAATIALIITGSVSAIGALAAGIVSIIKALNEVRVQTAANSEAITASRADVADVKETVILVKQQTDGIMEKVAQQANAAGLAQGTATEAQAGAERAATKADETAAITADVALKHQADAAAAVPPPTPAEVVDAAVSQALTDSNMERVAAETAKVAAATERVADAAESQDDEKKPS